jgi:hypothetical protein
LLSIKKGSLVAIAKNPFIYLSIAFHVGYTVHAVCMTALKSGDRDSANIRPRASATDNRTAAALEQAERAGFR